MSDQLNANQAQTRYSVNRSTVRRWINDGKLVADDDGYFSEADFLVLFRKSSAWERQRLAKAAAERQQAPELPLQERNQLTGEVQPPTLESAYTPPKASGGGEEQAGLSLTDKRNVDLATSLEKLRGEQRKNAIADGKTIARSLVEKAFGQLEEIDRTEWESMPARSADAILAACEISDPAMRAEVIRVLEDEVYSTIRSCKVAMVGFLKGLPRIEVRA